MLFPFQWSITIKTSLFRKMLPFGYQYFSLYYQTGPLSLQSYTASSSTGPCHLLCSSKWNRNSYWFFPMDLSLLSSDFLLLLPLSLARCYSIDAMQPLAISTLSTLGSPTSHQLFSSSSLASQSAASRRSPATATASSPQPTWSIPFPLRCTLRCPPNSGIACLIEEVVSWMVPKDCSLHR